VARASGGLIGTSPRHAGGRAVRRMADQVVQYF
jgi:hypothetical protein